MAMGTFILDKQQEKKLTSLQTKFGAGFAFHSNLPALGPSQRLSHIIPLKVIRNTVPSFQNEDFSLRERKSGHIFVEIFFNPFHV